MKNVLGKLTQKCNISADPIEKLLKNQTVQHSKHVQSFRDVRQFNFRIKYYEKEAFKTFKLKKMG